MYTLIPYVKCKTGKTYLIASRVEIWGGEGTQCLKGAHERALGGDDLLFADL